MKTTTTTATEREHERPLGKELQDRLAVLGLRQQSNNSAHFPISSSSLRKFMAAVFAIASILLVAECIARLVICSINPIQFGSSEFDAKMRMVDTPLPPGKPCIYFLGTSNTSSAIYADLIASRLQKAGKDIVVRNIGCSGSYPKEQLLILGHALKRSPGPAMLIYECIPGAFVLPEGTINEFGPRFKNSLYARNLQSDWPILKRFDLWMKQNICLVRYRSTLRERLTEIPANIFAPHEFIWKKASTNSTNADISPSGWAPIYQMLNEDTLNSTIRRRSAWIAGVKEKESAEKKRSKYFFAQNIFALARKYNVKTALLWLPLHPRFQSVSNSALHTTDQEATAQIVNAAKLDNCQLIDMHHYDIEQDFFDCYHLNASGGVEISKKIADQLIAQSDVYLTPLVDGAR